MSSSIVHNTAHRHESTRQVAQWFTYDHLPNHLATVSKMYADLAEGLILTTPDSPELTVALRKLLESKDCAVRAKVAAVKLEQDAEAGR